MLVFCYSLRLYYGQGDCVVLQPTSGDMEELQEIVARLKAVTPGCEVGGDIYLYIVFHHFHH